MHVVSIPDVLSGEGIDYDRLRERVFELVPSFYSWLKSPVEDDVILHDILLSSLDEQGDLYRLSDGRLDLLLVDALETLRWCHQRFPHAIYMYHHPFVNQLYIVTSP